MTEIESPEKTILTVQQLNQTARFLLEEGFGQAWVKGELSNLSMPHSGHIYFTLKDQHAQIRCALFKGSARHLSFTLEEGMAVIVQATVSVYEARGDYQLIVTHLEKAGQGLLQQAFEALKAKLQTEGLFDKFHKKTLPRFPQNIGIITSHTGAAIQDILSVLKRRYPIAPITIYHTPVQGKGAATKIALAIQYANQHPHDVLILARGGGSLEDLWEFNEEIVARSIFESRIPLVSGVGHEIDFTIADFIADYRAPTPSAAAETITPDYVEVIALFQQKQDRLIYTLQRTLQTLAQKIDLLEKRLKDPKQRLQQAQLQCTHLKQRLLSTMKNNLARLTQRWTHASSALHSVSPLATLNRGYAIVTRADASDLKEIVKAADTLKNGDKVKTQLSEGFFMSVVKK